jgi:poly(glycerol-phosphate) alpha-glucosyltransferase
MAALEAFAAGLPALLSPQCNLPEAYDCGCALEIPPDEQGMEEGLRRLFGLGAEATAAMKAGARRLVAERFDWDVIAEKFAALYSTMAGAELRAP